MKDYNDLTEKIIGCAYRVSNVLGTGFLEKVYENALAYELSKNKISVSCQYPLNVQYDGVIVGNYFVDLLIENEIIVELKAVKGFDDSHLAQCMNYLRATDKKLALLINFGNKKVQIKRVVNGF
jgi:GxxExxY protein